MMHRLGATFYVIWGVLHVNAAYMLYQMGVAMDPSVLEARISQAAWHLLFFGVVAISRHGNPMALTINLCRKPR